MSASCLMIPCFVWWVCACSACRVQRVSAIDGRPCSHAVCQAILPGPEAAARAAAAASNKQRSQAEEAIKAAVAAALQTLGLLKQCITLLASTS